MAEISVADDRNEEIDATNQAVLDLEELGGVSASTGDVPSIEVDPTAGGFLGDAKAIKTTPSTDLEVPEIEEVGSRDTNIPSDLSEEDLTVGGFVGTPEESTAPDILRGIVSGFTRGGLILPGSVMGGVAGGIIAGPPGVVIGGITGLIATAWAGENAARELEEHGIGINPLDVEERRKPAAVFGQVLGATFGGAGSVYVITKTGLRLAASIPGTFINRVLDWGKANPGRFAFLETTSAISAAGGEAAFESQYPDMPIARAGVGIAAGVLNPTNMAVFVGRKVFQSFSTMRGFFGTNAAGRELNRLWKAAEEDPETLLRLLADTEAINKMLPELSQGTLAQQTGHKVLIDLEANLAALDQKFFVHRSNVAEATLEAMVNAIRLLKASGEPAALQEAARLWRVRSEMGLERLAAYAEMDARTATANILKAGDDTVDEGKISAELTEILGNSLSIARGIERELWAAAAKGMDTPATWKSFFKLKSILEGELSGSAKLPEQIIEQAEVIRKAGEVLEAVQKGVKVPAAQVKEAQKRFSVRELLNFRSELLEEARATPVERSKLARRLGLMAEAVLDDVVRAGASAKGKKSIAGTTPLGDAREYSRLLNDIFLRTFIGQTRKETAFGYAVPPEVVLRTALASGGAKAALRFQELTAGANFIPVRKLSDGGSTLFRQQMAEMDANSKLVYDLQSRFLRIAADAAVDNEGRLNIKSLQTFMKKSAALLERFPEVKADLEYAISGEKNFVAWAKSIAQVRKIRDDRKAAIGGLLSTESVSEYIRGALAGPTPIAKLDEALRVARGSEAPSGAEDGLQVAIWENIFGAATRRDGATDLDVLLHVINNPIKPGLPSIKEWMSANGLLKVDDANVINQINNLEANLRAAIGGQVTGEEITSTPSMFFNFGLRLTGAEAGAAVLSAGQKAVGASGNMASSLIARTRGSQLAVDLLQRMPRVGIRQMLTDALSGAPIRPNGERYGLIKELMKQLDTPAQVSQSAIRIHAYAWQAGLLGLEDQIRSNDIEQPKLPETDPTVGGFVSVPESGFDRFKNLFFRQQTSPIPGVVE